MKKIIFATLVAFGLVGCGSNGTTYVKEAPMLPEEPTNGTNIIVTAEEGSSAGLRYTEVSDGSVLITCTESDNCGNITVYEATEVNTTI